VAATPFLLACVFISQLAAPGNFVTFFARIAAVLPLYFAPVWVLALTAEERLAAREYLTRKLIRRRSVREAV
jgi:hypothetical protein